MIAMDFNLCSCLFLWFLSLYITSSASQLCEGPDGEECCYGYVWNEAQNNCTQCTDGFYGRNCTTPCPKPYFGSACLLKCMCSSENCHHVYGCKRIPSECATGKYSEYCELSCRYPNYGNRCQLVCPCDEAFCDPSSGCEEDYSSLHSIEISTVPVAASSAIYTEVTTEAALRSINIPNTDKICAEEKGNVNENNSTSLIAGIISLLILAGMLLTLYAMAYLHKSHVYSSSTYSE
ncbi:multiple epidermal growth factor-like domains protein 11 isoform X1 [Ostrea edulis]|uniref:multiple epidermal growth factor-like domains protein 11 isoform X1 n=1 Tax=Ostrea edulis TaxID=37623 RepID=UPI0024AFA460|nr:multiple epidermal growth factor-like domains protein 11 isoform X1 [Ostrea edulis]XP_056013516.1 multiple epidermal growth factor-like domains protein 11 isoform X1 [Ostrea edulis]